MIADVADVIPREHHAALKAQGVVNTAQLYERIVSRTARRAMATRSAIPIRELARWARFLDLMQLQSLGPKMVRLLNAAGIDTLRDFQKASADGLHPKMRAVNRGGKYSEVVPGVEVLRAWIASSRKVTPRLE